MEEDSRTFTRISLTIPPNLWGHKKIKLKNKYNQLTDADLHFVVGHERDLLTRLQAKLGLSEGELTAIINAL